MGMKTARRYFVAVILLTSFSIFILYHRFIKDYPVKIQGRLVNTSVCRIPDVHPYDDSISRIVGRGQFIECNKFPTYTFENARRIHINWKEINESQFKDTLSYCKIRPIVRPVNSTTDHNSHAYLEESPRFTVSIATEHEFIHVRCYDKNNKFLFHGFHTIIFEKEEVEKRCKERQRETRKRNPKIEKPLSVLLVIVDSVSRLNSVRFMKRTRKFLMETMDAVDFGGFNKVGYGTFHNMIPVLSGKFYEELPYDFRSPNVFDNYTFLWDQYAKKGFRTYIGEDLPNGALFDYSKKGFHKTPTDYYNRHLFLTMYDQPNIVYNDENCILNQQQTNWVLNPGYKFLKLFKDKPYFSFLLITRLTHDILERTAAADDLYYKFLSNAHNDGILNNTITVVMADHGMRFGPIRETYIGLLEERLPMLYISTPKWFSQKYPIHMENLRNNSKKLTTHFDLYETLNDMLTFDGSLKVNSVKNRAMNLFSEIPEGRTCDDASIEAHWCTCTKLENVDMKANAIQNVAAFFVNSINDQLKDVSHLCEHLSVGEMTQVYRVKQSDSDKNNNLIVYKLVIRANPGRGLFEGTVTYDLQKRSYRMSSEISRINAYGGEKRCKVNYLQERLCYCKSNAKNR